jgi:hypothetical protein
MQLPPSLLEALRSPTAASIWQARGDLLSGGLEPGARAFELLRELHGYLDRLETGGASRDHSERASVMEIGSLSGVVAADLAEADDAAEWARRLLSATITEGLAVMATRQHVKAWRGELDSVHREAAWFLYDELWRWAARRKPDLDPVERRRLLDQLLAPVRDDEPSRQKQLIVCSLLALLVVDSLAGDGEQR